MQRGQARESGRQSPPPPLRGARNTAAPSCAGPPLPAPTLQEWAKGAAPSTQLRQWFAHDPAKWQEFKRRYWAELDAAPDAWRPLAAATAAEGKAS